jgi:hypothetical protein
VSHLSAHFFVRQANGRLVDALRHAPALARLVTDPALDFDPAAYDRLYETEIPEDRRERLRGTHERKRERELVMREEARRRVVAGGLALEDVGHGVGIEQCYQGVETILSGTAGALLVTEAGTPIGPDLGYGPAYYHAAGDVIEILAAFDSIDRETASDRIRAAESSRGGPGWSTEEIERAAWGPLVTLRELLRVCARRGDGVLKWWS